MAKKVLIFVDRMRAGGIQKLLLDLTKEFDREKIIPEFLLLDDGENYVLEDELRKLAKVYKLDGIWIRTPQDYFTYFKAVDSFFEEHHDYCAVHINSGPKNYYILKRAKKYGVPVRIAHSHSTDFSTKSKISKFIGNIMKFPMKKYSNFHIGCSELAMEWMFGKKYNKLENNIIVKNGVDIEKFKFNSDIRNKVRNNIGINDKIVIGNVGRFTSTKNHTRILDIFQEIHRQNSDTILLLAGIGELMDEIKSKTVKLGLENCVKFLGFRNDICDLLQAFDIYLMPSLYEGFPVTGVEAQVAGLPCIFSDTITRSAKLLPETEYISLKESNKRWANETLSLVGVSDRNKAQDVLKESGFDIKDMARKLEEIYCK